MAWPSNLVRTKNWGTEILTDTDLEGQLDLIISYIDAMMDSTTGHTHDGTDNHGKAIAITDLTGVLLETHGGTGQSTYAQGDILYSDATNSLDKLSAGTSGQVLVTGGAGANPSWGSLFTHETEVTSTSDELSTSNSWSDTTLSITFTATANKLIVISFHGYIRQDASGAESGSDKWGGIRIYDSSTSTVLAKAVGQISFQAPGSSTPVTWIGFLSAGSHTIKIQKKGSQQSYNGGFMGTEFTATLNIYR